MIYFCCDERRRNARREDPSSTASIFWRSWTTRPIRSSCASATLHVHFLHPLAPGALTARERAHRRRRAHPRHQNRRRRNGRPRLAARLAAEALSSERAGRARGRAGRFFDLHFAPGGPDASMTEPPAGFRSHPLGRRLLFQGRLPERFRLPARHRSARPKPLPQPEIDYLAKDYASFRQLMLDRMAMLLPAVEGAQPGGPGHRAGRVAGLRR